MFFTRAADNLPAVFSSQAAVNSVRYESSCEGHNHIAPLPWVRGAISQNFSTTAISSLMISPSSMLVGGRAQKVCAGNDGSVHRKCPVLLHLQRKSSLPGENQMRKKNLIRQRYKVEIISSIHGYNVSQIVWWGIHYRKCAKGCSIKSVFNEDLK